MIFDWVIRAVKLNRGDEATQADKGMYLRTLFIWSSRTVNLIYERNWISCFLEEEIFQVINVLHLTWGSGRTSACMLSCVQFFAAPVTVAFQVPLSMGFSRLDYWSRLPLPSLVDLPNSGMELGSPAFQADSLPSEPPGNLINSHKCSKLM